MTKPRILIVDDEVSFTPLLSLGLEQTGRFEVKVENDGAQALAAARAFRPDLVLLDVIMPGISGEGVAAQLKGDPTLRTTPVVFLTAVVSREETQGQRQMIGGRLFLAKPVGLEEVTACIETVIGVHAVPAPAPRRWPWPLKRAA